MVQSEQLFGHLTMQANGKHKIQRMLATALAFQLTWSF